MDEQQVRDICIRRKNGEARSSVYEDYKTLLTLGGFDGIWYYTTWKNIIID